MVPVLLTKAINSWNPVIVFLVDLSFLWLSQPYHSIILSLKTMKSEVLKVIVLVSTTLQVARAQFGNFGQQCDYTRLHQASVRKQQCTQELDELIVQAVREIQRSDRMCYRGLAEAIQKCGQPLLSFMEQNDMDTEGIMDCCFPGRTTSRSLRRCEFRNKDHPDKMDEVKYHGKDDDHARIKRGIGMFDEETKRRWMSSLTMGDLLLWGTKGKAEIITKLMWCAGEHRMINNQAIDAYRRYKDQLIAKLFQCENIVVQEATNCTDVPTQDLECLMKGFAWIGEFVESCITSCMPQSLDFFCKMMTRNQGTNTFPSQNIYSYPYNVNP